MFGLKDGSNDPVKLALPLLKTHMQTLRIASKLRLKGAVLELMVRWRL
jgi:hypothetical protein